MSQNGRKRISIGSARPFGFYALHLIAELNLSLRILSYVYSEDDLLLEALEEGSSIDPGDKNDGAIIEDDEGLPAQGGLNENADVAFEYLANDDVVRDSPTA